MPRGVKNTAPADTVTVTTTEPIEAVIDAKADIEIFKSAIIDLGTRLCLDVQEGRAKQPIETLKEISNLYNAVK